MEKYQNLFLEKINKTITHWKNIDSISNNELYHLLHSIKGTASSIGLNELTETAEKLLVQIEENEQKDWNQDNWRIFIHDLLFYLESEVNVSQLKKDIRDDTTVKKDENHLILLIDNNAEMITYLKKELEKEGWTVLAALNPDKANSVFYSKKPDCILLNINLPDFNALKIMGQMVNTAKELLIPILISSNESTKHMRINAYDIGVSDFITQPIESDELIARIRNKIQYKEIINSAILIDELTGAYNRKFLSNEIKRLLDNQNDVIEASIALLDIDFFKNINDTYGHYYGDIVLKTFANCMMNEKRACDYLVRYGGEEFVLVMPRLSGQEAVKHIQSLKTIFTQITFQNDHHSNFSCSFSAGVSYIDHQDIHLEVLLKEADQALYQAKKSGRNQVILYDKDMSLSTNSQKILRIGIIDDDSVIHNLLTDYLDSFTFEDFKVEVKTFREGESFFNSKWHKKEGKYIILLDGIMPRMDGLEVLKKIRHECPEDDFIIIMLTGRKNEKDIIKALQNGADDYITKPFNIKELEARIKRLALRLL